MNGILSRFLLKFVENTLPGKDMVELGEIKYGLDAAISFSVKTTAILIIGCCLGLATYVLTTFICLAVIRPFAGGVHAKNDFQCMLLTSFMVFFIIYLSLYFYIPAAAKGLIYACTFILLLKYAPADTEEKPYINEKLKKRLKMLSLTVSSLMMASSIFVFQGITGNIIILSLLFSGLLTTPGVYKIMGRRYRNFEYFQI